MAVEVDEMRDVRSLLGGVRGVLFDFDGPVCRLFPGDSSRPVADTLRCLMADAGVKDVLTAEEQQNKDPHTVLRAVHRAMRDDSLVAALEAEVTQGELTAARKAQLTPGAASFITRLAQRGLRLAVVTNNSAEAASYYLKSKGLQGCFDAVLGRTCDLDRMKPDPYVVERALEDLGLGSGEAVMIGDSPADVTAASRAGVAFIGFGRDEHKESKLRWAGADMIVGSYARLLDEG